MIPQPSELEQPDFSKYTIDASQTSNEVPPSRPVNTLLQVYHASCGLNEFMTSRIWFKDTAEQETEWIPTHFLGRGFLEILDFGERGMLQMVPSLTNLPSKRWKESKGERERESQSQSQSKSKTTTCLPHEPTTKQLATKTSSTNSKSNATSSPKSAGRRRK